MAVVGKRKTQDWGEEEGEEGYVGDEEDAEDSYSRAFKKIITSAHSTEPVLAARKEIFKKKLKEQANEEGKNKSSKKQDNEHGHVLPQPHVDAKEIALIKLATKGVVTLFNAVNKAQKVQAGSESLKPRDAKAIVKQSKAAFLSELKSQSGTTQDNQLEVDEPQQKPGWSVLQDDFMLGKPKLKDWDKKGDASSDEDDDSDINNDEDM